jgi:hypothetical protein
MSTFIQLAGSGLTPSPSSTASKLIFDVKYDEAISKGDAVYVSGANGTNILVKKADYSTEATSSKTLGLATESGALNHQGKVITYGLLDGIDTSAAGGPGDAVWLGAAGGKIYGLTNKPYAPKHLVSLGVVTKDNASTGEIFVKTQNGFELDELHDVQLKGAAAPTDGQVLTYEAATQLWKAKSLVSDNEAPIQFVMAATEGALVGSPVYYNGDDNDGIGATLTGSNIVLSDGTATGRIDTNYIPDADDLILVKNQVDPKQNGIYVITQIGSAVAPLAPYILTRADDCNEPFELYPLQVNVFQGLVNGTKYFTQTNVAWGSATPPVIGVTPVTPPLTQADIVFELTNLTTAPLQITFVDNATSTALPLCVYTDGSDPSKPGVGAILSASGAGLLIVSGMSASSTTTTTNTFTTLLVKNQLEPRHNGTYQVVNPGATNARWQLRRIDNLASGFNKANRIVFCSHNLSEFSGSYFIPTWNPTLINKNIGQTTPAFPLASNRIDYVGYTPPSVKPFGFRDPSGAYRMFSSLQRAIDQAQITLPNPNSNNQSVTVEVFNNTLINSLATTIAITRAGTGYATGSFTSNIGGGSGTGMQATVTYAGGGVSSIGIINPGSGYLVGDVLSVIQTTTGLTAILTITAVPHTPILLRDRVNINGNNYNYTVISTSAVGLTTNVFADNGVNVNVNINDFIIQKRVAAGAYAAAHNSVLRVTGPLSDIDLAGSELQAAFCTALNVSSGPIPTGTSSGTLSTNSGYTTPGTYTNVGLTGGSGTGVLATVTVSGGAITAVNITQTGQGYLNGNVLGFPTTIPFVAGTAATFTITGIVRQETRVANVNITTDRAVGIDLINGYVSEAYINDITQNAGVLSIPGAVVQTLGVLSDCTVKYTSGSSGISNVGGRIINCDVFAIGGAFSSAISNGGGSASNPSYAIDCSGYVINGNALTIGLNSVTQSCKGQSVNGNGISSNGQFDARLFQCTGITASTNSANAGIQAVNIWLYDCIGYNNGVSGGGSGILYNGFNGNGIITGCTGVSKSGPGLSTGTSNVALAILDSKFFGGTVSPGSPGIFFTVAPTLSIITTISGCTISSGNPSVPCVGNMFVTVTIAATTAPANTYTGTLNGGNGTGATASVVVAGGLVTSITITNSGNGYLPGDVLTLTAVSGAQFTVVNLPVRYANNKFLGSTRPVYSAITQTLAASTEDSFGNIKID